MTQSEKNISRLVKLAGDPNKPGRAFTESLINNALGELRQLKTAKKREEKNMIMEVSWWGKSLGWAAMFAAACTAGLAFAASALLKINLLLQTVIIVTAFFNWLIYLGEHIL